jgi:hypothetical protein
MIKLPKKSLLLFVVVVAAMASASSASAATFDGVGQHTLTSSNLGFNVAALGAGWSCASSVFEVNVPVGGATATVTGASFSGCVGTGVLAGAADVAATNLPWEMTTLGNPGEVIIDGIHLAFNFTAAAVTFTLEGNLTTPFNNATHTATYSGQTITSTSAFGTAPVGLTGSLRDDQQTLTVT